MSPEEVQQELDNGSRFVYYTYTISILIMTFKRSSSVYLLRQEDNSFTQSWPYTLMTLVLGWWGIPWGPIYSLGSLGTNLSGGKDVTGNVAVGPRRQMPTAVAEF